MKKKAFTLIELLAVIVLLVIIMLVFAPDILKIISKSEKNTYSVKEKLVARAGEDYAILSNIALPVLAGEQKLINMETLITNNFMTPIYDLTDKENACLGYLVIEKNTAYGHNYKSCLFCTNYHTEDSDCHTDRMSIIGTETPVLLMFNNTPYYVELGSTYNDPGCAAYDTDGTNITGRMIVTGLPINTSNIGINNVIYNVQSEEGVSAVPVTREVVVRDTTAPVVTIGMNGNLTPSKTHSTAVTVTDIAGLSELKYLWSTSATAPNDILFTDTFTSGQTIDSPTSLNGTYYLWIYAIDNNSNLTKIRTNAFKFDNILPTISTATIVSNNSLNDKQAKNENTITLTISFSEAIGNAPTITIGGRSTTVVGNGATRTATYTIPADESTLAEGGLSISISNYNDLAGNTGNSSTTITSGGTVNYDRTSPTYSYFYIGGSGNPSVISTTNTILSSSLDGATQMCISTTTSCSAWETYAASKAHILQSGNGLKTLYVWYRDQADNQIGYYADSVTLDAGKPAVASATILSDNALNNKQAKNGDEVTLSITFAESISNTPTVTIGGRSATVTGSGTTRTATYTISAGESTLAEGALGINISNYQDTAGNTGDPSTTITSGGTVNYDRTIPTLSYFYIGGSGNPAYITSLNTVLFSSGSGVSQMCISTTTSCSTWEAYSDTNSYTVSSGEGIKTLYAWYRDTAGNTTSMNTDSVTYDMAAPSVTSATIVSDNALSNKQAKNGNIVTLNITFSETIGNTPTITIGGRSASVSGSGTTRTATYTIPSAESSLGQGELGISISNYLDNSGRTGSTSTTITSGGTVNYDRTPPSVGYFYIGGTGNPSYITSLSTTLYSNVTGVSTMCVNSGCSWETYAASKAYSWGSGTYGETKSMSITYRDQAGNTSGGSDSVLYIQGSHSQSFTCLVSGYSSSTLGWSTGTSTVIQGSAEYLNYYGVMYFGASAFNSIRSEDANYDITSVTVRIKSHKNYQRTVRLYVGGPCPTPDYGSNGISGSDPTPVGGSTNYVEAVVAANAWGVWTISKGAWTNALLNANAACLYINRGNDSGSYWEGDGALDADKPTIQINWSPNP